MALGAESYTFTVAGHHPIQVQPRDLRRYSVSGRRFQVSAWPERR
ncbi:hypothetical protein ACFPIJ_28570 [Dactylosporangium cerinum]|uniref:Uncharacterized protein n=1 Tax=Dactylosporangium cerinum TaxID=1434730 RepID=A0ABV9W2K4_9ACTN